MKVFKFGGASIKDADGFRNVKRILEFYKQDELVLIVSALGKTTNALEQIAKAYINKTGDAIGLLNKLRAHHFEILSSLVPKNHSAFDELNNSFLEIDWILEDEPSDSYDYVYDQIVSIGEMASTKMLAAFLNENGLKVQWKDARDFIKTDNNYREGKIDWDKTESNCTEKIPAILKQEWMLTQGFIGGTSENLTTTLGREGSDYSAAVIAYCTNAESVTIWKDVPGVLNADPRYFTDPKKIDELSYKEAIEMTFYGATVIHPKTMKPLQNKNIPLYVKSFLYPELEGTVIRENVMSENVIPVLVLKTDQILISVSPKDFSFMDEENLENIFNLMVKHRVHFNMMQNAAISFSFCADHIPQRINPFLEELSSQYKILTNDGLQLLTIRHYNDEVVQQQTANRKILLEQKTRQTIQMVIEII
ncbi:aspartokinase [Bacteroidota bacterium]|nr:aspartokinase [Bacteroidota bacterium]